jgi:transketolase
VTEKIALRQAYGEILAEVGKDERIFVLDSDVSKSTKTCEFEKKYPVMFINMGIAESNMACVAAGIATCDRIVFINGFAVFTALRAYEQIRNSIGYPFLNVRIVATHAGISAGEDGASHQAVEDIAIMRSMPNMTVISPADAIEIREAVKASLEYRGPIYMRLGRIPEPVINRREDYRFTLGKGITLKKGRDVAIVATGSMVHEALLAESILSQRSIHARVINIHTIKPIDEDLIIQAAEETGAIITCEEHSVIGGLGSAVAEVLVRKCPVPMGFVGINDCFGKSGKYEVLKERYGLTKDDIVRTVLNVISSEQGVA